MPEIIGNAGSTGNLAWIMWDDSSWSELMAPSEASALVSRTGGSKNRGGAVQQGAMPTPEQIYNSQQGPAEGAGPTGSPIAGLTPQQIAQYNQQGLTDRNGIPVNQQAADTIKAQMAPPPAPPAATPPTSTPQFVAPGAPPPTDALQPGPAPATTQKMQVDHANPDVQAELAARAVASAQGISVDQARQLIQTPEYAATKATLMAQASGGGLDQFLEDVPAVTPGTGSVTGGNPPAYVPNSSTATGTPNVGSGAAANPQPPGVPGAAPGPAAPASAGAMDPALYEYYNAQAEALKLQAATAAANQAYLNNKLLTVDQLAALADKAYKEADILIRQEAQKSDLGIAVAKLTGYYNGQQTLEGQNQQFQQGLSVAQLAGSLRGPSNAFQQQAVLHGLNSMGMSNAVDAISGNRYLPAFQAPQASPVPMSLSSVANDIRAGGNLTYGGQSGGQQQNPASLYSIMGEQQPQVANAQGYLNALPNPNQIAGREWANLGADSQQFLLSGYEAKGYSANDVQDQIRRGLPQFTAPRAALIAA